MLWVVTYQITLVARLCFCWLLCVGSCLVCVWSRFEEPGGSTISGHPRVVEGTLRKEPEARKRQREARAARQAELQLGLQEEVKRLKNLKMREIQDRCVWGGEGQGR